MIHCQFEDGHPVLLRHTTVNNIVIDGDKVLLARRADWLLEGGKWCLPGGYLDRDERVADGALRELREETGFAGTIVGLMEIIDWPDRPQEDKQNIVFTFVVQVGEKVGEPDHETAALQWFSWDQLPPADQFAFDHHEQLLRYQQAVQQNRLNNLLTMPFASREFHPEK